MIPLHKHYVMYSYEFGSYHPGSYGGEYCQVAGRNESQWCSFGCCGDDNSQCCHANLALIVGISVLSLLFLSIVAGVCCCCCCCLRRIESKSVPGQVLSLQQPPPPYNLTMEGQASNYSSGVYDNSNRGTSSTEIRPPSDHLPPQNYPPGYYAPPAYSELQASSASSPPSSPTSPEAFSIPLPPPPYSRELAGYDNEAFKETL